MKINKSKAQVQMGESIAVLFIFLILIGLGSIFVVNVFQGSLERTKEENLQLKAIDIAQRVSFLPELQCSADNIVTEPCIDLLKLTAASEVALTNELDYFPIFEYSTIIVEQIFPEQITPAPFTLYNKQPNRILNQQKVYLPTVLYNAIDKNYNFGWINVTIYS